MKPRPIKSIAARRRGVWGLAELAGTSTKYIRALAVSRVRLPDRDTEPDSFPPDSKGAPSQHQSPPHTLPLLLLQVEEGPDDAAENDCRGLVTSGESGSRILTVLLTPRERNTSDGLRLSHL